jgi:hypothetical protein
MKSAFFYSLFGGRRGDSRTPTQGFLDPAI